MKALQSLASLVYRIGYECKRGFYAAGICKSLNVAETTIICIGNLTVGGTGKTPFVAFLAKELASRSFRVAIVSRGYRGSANKSPTVVSKPDRILKKDYKDAGDEPLLLAKALPGIPVVIGRDRYEAARLAQQLFSPHLILLDDGYQHWRLARDFNIVLIDVSRPLENLKLLPAGTLREPLSALNRADIVIMTKCNLATEDALSTMENLVKEYAFNAIKVHAGLAFKEIKPYNNPTRSMALEELEGKKVIAFCGIANSESFFTMLTDTGAKILELFPYPDHHIYTFDDIEKIETAYREHRADMILTTDKDAVKLENVILKPEIYFYTCIAPFIWEKDEEVFWRTLNRPLPELRGVGDSSR